MPELVNREVALMGDLARDLLKLQELPEWGAMRAHFEDLKALAQASAYRALYVGSEGAKPLDQRAVDYRRGYLKACEDFVLYPERLVAQFEKAMERKQQSNG